MSEIKEIKNINPYGDKDNILQIDIDNPKDVFMLRRAIKSEGDYTFSIWHKSDSNSKITFNLFDISNETIDSTTEWQKYVKTVTITEEEFKNVNIYIQPQEGITSYFYEGYLTEGRADTSWTPAPEDTAEEIGSIYSTIDQTANQIRFEVTNEISNVQSALSVTESGIEAKVTGVSSDINNVSNDLNNTNSTITKYFEFTVDGLIIKSGEGQMQLHLDNDIVRFTKNGEQFGWWDGINFHTGNLYIDVYERAQFGNFAFVPRSDGSMSFLKVDDYVMIHIKKQPVSVTTKEGNTAKFTVEANGSGLTYQWQRKFGGDFTDVSDATTSSYTTKATTYQHDNGMGVTITVYIILIRCKITDIRGKVMYTDTVKLTAE